MNSNLSQIINQYKEDKQSVFNTWFINNEERLKAFRSIRRGVMQVVDDIKNKKFPNDFKDSSLEFVLTCITEQKQVFEGASHPFYWKPKLRIPDIYENEANKQAFGQFYYRKKIKHLYLALNKPMKCKAPFKLLIRCLKYKPNSTT